MNIVSKIKWYLKGFYNSFPIQLLILHLRRYQILLIFWAILISTIEGSFMSNFGAEALLLAPEYLSRVNYLSMMITGATAGMFIMSWNITTFILHSNHFKFLATTSKPFLKYCLNNAIIPLIFLGWYTVLCIRFNAHNELMSVMDIIKLITGFVLGLNIALTTAFWYFFRTEKAFIKAIEQGTNNLSYRILKRHFHEKGMLTVDWFFNTRFKLKKPRDVSHYSQHFIETVFKRHHFSAVVSIVISFLMLSLLGMLMDKPSFILPAAGAIFIFFSILIAGAGALSYWLKSWAFPVFFIAIGVLHITLEKEWIDPRNKAYGINYNNKDVRPEYSEQHIMRLCTPEKMEEDKQNMYNVLNNWKQKQQQEKPLLYVINVSGGGLRSATFTFKVLQRLDSLLNNQLCNNAFLFTGASGGMLGAAYYRELFRKKLTDPTINLQDSIYIENISKDLLNPLFSTFVTRDLFAPAQHFEEGEYSFIKDRGYAFEEQLNRNTKKVFEYNLSEIQQQEADADIPLFFFNSTITRDGRKMVVSTQPVSFMMRNTADAAEMPTADAIDYAAMFKYQDPYNIRMLSLLRMNATFPYVLPNVWMPSQPVVDVMDAGMRDNYGVESSMRFLNAMRNWIKENTSGVVFIQIRDRKYGDWDDPYEDMGISSLAAKPIFTLQNNWMKFQSYYYREMMHYMQQDYPVPIHNIYFNYEPAPKAKKAALNFHLTTNEKMDIKNAINIINNQQALEALAKITGKQ